MLSSWIVCWWSVSLSARVTDLVITPLSSWKVFKSSSSVEWFNRSLLVKKGLNPTTELMSLSMAFKLYISILKYDWISEFRFLHSSSSVFQVSINSSFSFCVPLLLYIYDLNMSASLRGKPRAFNVLNIVNAVSTVLCPANGEIYAQQDMHYDSK